MKWDMTVADLLKTDGLVGLKLSFSVWDWNKIRKHTEIGYARSRLPPSFGRPVAVH